MKYLVILLFSLSIYASWDGIELLDVSSQTQTILDSEAESGDIIKHSEINAKFNAIKVRVQDNKMKSSSFVGSIIYGLSHGSLYMVNTIDTWVDFQAGGTIASQQIAGSVVGSVFNLGITIESAKAGYYNIITSGSIVSNGNNYNRLRLTNTGNSQSRGNATVYLDNGFFDAVSGIFYHDGIGDLTVVPQGKVSSNSIYIFLDGENYNFTISAIYLGP